MEVQTLFAPRSEEGNNHGQWTGGAAAQNGHGTLSVGRSAINATGETNANALALAKHNERDAKGGEEAKEALRWRRENGVGLYWVVWSGEGERLRGLLN